MTEVLSLRLKEEPMSKLRRVARQRGLTTSETAARLLTEAIRCNEFAFIDFRDSPLGRRAYVQGSSLAVWEVVMVAQSYDLDSGRTAAHLEWPVHRVQAALNYAQAYPDEIDTAIADNDAVDFATLRRMLPQAVEFAVGDEDSVSEATVCAPTGVG